MGVYLASFTVTLMDPPIDCTHYLYLSGLVLIVPCVATVMGSVRKNLEEYFWNQNNF